MIAALAQNIQVFFLIVARVLAMLEVAPLFNSRAIPHTARIGLALFVAVTVFPWVLPSMTPVDSMSVANYGLLVIGEVMLGIISGVYLLIVFTAFQVAGQFFSLQMGFGASQVFDPLAQIQIPLMGQFLNIIGMLIFLSVSGFQKLIMVGVYRSFQSVQAIDLVTGRAHLFSVFAKSLGGLFTSALTIAFPIMGSLLLVSVTMGLLAKAAPQMNLLMMGFPIAIGVAYLVLIMAMPFLVGSFIQIIDRSFEALASLFGGIGTLGSGP